MSFDRTLQRRWAFTMLELLLATALLALTVTLIMAASNSITKSWQKLDRKQQKLQQVLKLDRTLDAMLSNIVPFRWPDAEGGTRAVFSGDKDEVHFAYMHQINRLRDGGIRFVKLALEKGVFTACYQERPLLDVRYPDKIHRTVLADEVERIEIQYADWLPEAGCVWVDQWNTENRQRLDAPLAVLLRIYWEDGSWESWMRRTAGSGQYERWGTPQSDVL